MTFYIRTTTCLKAKLLHPRVMPQVFSKTDNAILNLVEKFYCERRNHEVVKFPITLFKKIDPLGSSFEVLQFYPEDFIKWR